MSKYTVYSKNDCPFCRRAVILLLQEELEYEEIKLDEADDYEKAVGELAAHLTLDDPIALSEFEAYERE